MYKRLGNSAFTLVEILAAITIIGLIVAVAVPSIATINKKVNERLFETKKELILSAAELYAQDSKNIYSSCTETGSPGCNISVGVLITQNYIKPDIKKDDENCTNEYSEGCIINPINKEILNEVQINITYKKKTFEASSNW